jgi:DNA polymerase-4
MTEPTFAATRKIIHVDMDAFYASVEQRDDPTLRGKPLAVGGSAKRGVVAAASYEARKFGVKSAMAGVTARRRCPQLLFVKPRFDVYRSVSQQLHEIFARYSNAVEPLSLDEAYLDVSADLAGLGSATAIAERIRADIREELGLTASAGVSYNKFIAKVASDQNKPDGICVVRPGEGADFVAALPARRFYGVGPRTAERMAGLGIHSGSDLRAQTLEFLEHHFGKSANYLYRASRGEDDRPVRPDRERKSIGGERTYSDDLRSDQALRDALEHIIEIVWERIDRNAAQGRTVTLKVKYADFRQITRARSVTPAVANRQAFAQLARELLEALLPVEQGVRLLGLTLSGLASGTRETAGPTDAVAEPLPVQATLAF